MSLSIYSLPFLICSCGNSSHHSAVLICFWGYNENNDLCLFLFTQGSYGIVKLAYNEEDETHYVSKKITNTRDKFCKKAFESTANCPFADRCMSYIVNKFEHVHGCWPGDVPMWVGVRRYMCGHMGIPTWADWQKDRHDWKHYLSATSLASGKKFFLMDMRQIYECSSVR